MTDVLLGAAIGAVALTVPTYLGLALRTHLKWRRIVRDRRAAAAHRTERDAHIAQQAASRDADRIWFDRPCGGFLVFPHPPHDAEMAAARDADRVARVAEGGGV